jgi:hypothetical protein
METPSPRGSTDITRSQNTYPQIGSIAKTTRRLLLAALLIGSTLSHGCATQEKANKPQTAKKYDFTKPGKVRQVSRKIIFCAASRRDIVAEEQRCTSNKEITKEKGQYCLKCDTTTEIIEYN